MSSLYTCIVIFGSNMNVAVGIKHFINTKVSPRIPAYPLSHCYKTPYIVNVKVDPYVWNQYLHICSTPSSVSS